MRGNLILEVKNVKFSNVIKVRYSPITSGITLTYGPGVDSASNSNEYQEYFLEVKAAGA